MGRKSEKNKRKILVKFVRNTDEKIGEKSRFSPERLTTRSYPQYFKRKI